MENNIRKKNIDNVRSKTISGDRKLAGKKLSIIGYLRIQTQNPSVGFLAIIFLLVISLLSIPIVPKVYTAVELNEAKKVAFEEKLMPRSLYIPVNMLPYVRFQYQALSNGKKYTWDNPVFKSGSCHVDNLMAMPEGIYKRAIQTGCFQFNELQMQHAGVCEKDNCQIDPNLKIRIDYIMSQIEEPFWGKGFVEEINRCEGTILDNFEEGC